MAATDATGGYAGLKIYTVAQGKARFVVPLFRATSGEMVALIEADYLGQMRPGAATGVATRVAMEDIVVAGRVYEIARERGMGREVPIWEEGRSAEGRG